MACLSPLFSPRRSWVLTLLLWLPSVSGKCIFDDVQQSIRLVTPPPNPYAPPLRASGNDDANAGHLVALATSMDAPSFKTARRATPTAVRRASSKRSKRTYGEAARPARPPQPIRIQAWVPRESPALSPAERERLETAVSEAVGTVSGLLSVRRVPGRFRLSRDVNKYCKFIWRNASAANYNKCGRANENYRTESCLGVIIPDDHLSGCAVYPHPDSPTLTVLRPEGAGLPNTDFLLYLHTQNTDKCRAEPSVLAYAVHCQTDSQGRPLAGVVVICRDQLSGEGYSHQGTVQTVIHELFHVLGFSKELFSTWRDCSYSSQMGAGCSPRGQAANVDEGGQARLYTQSVIGALQKHLRSTHSELGGPLENLDAGSGGLSSHWEARVLQGSIMAAALGDPAVVRIDPITLAALQDTGWYSANLSRAQSLVWGEGDGALFGSLSTCHNASSFFCAGSGLGCHYLHLHKGQCQSDPYLEGCRVYKPLANASECWKEENERDGMVEEWSGEIYRSDSRCFFSNLSRENLSLSDSVVGRCYRRRCTGMNRYQIQVTGSDWLDCPAGGAIQVSGYRGLVFCPDKRLCHHSDIAPPINSQLRLSTTVPSSTEKDDRLIQQHATPDPSLTLDPANPSSVPVSSAEVTVASVLGATAALSLLGAFMAAYRKCRSAGVRVHAALEAPPALQLQSAQCRTKHC